MKGPRLPNDRLRTLLAEARWTGGDLARGVNAVAAESGLRLEYRRASVAQWLAGGQPRPPVPELVTEALSRVLGRLISLTDAGFTGTGQRDQEGGTNEAEGIAAGTELTGLGRIAGSTRREALRYSVYSLSALMVPGLPEAADMVAKASSAAQHPLRVGKTEIAAATTTIRMFAEADETLGASLVRAPLADYLARTVAPWLRATAATDDVQRRMLTVAAELAYLCGFMCFDDELHGPAQRYYRTALRLSAEAGDPAAYAITLRSMSTQARVLGHHRQAARLAETAVETAGTKVPARTRAFLLGQEAVAAAAEGDRHRAVSVLSAAERELDAVTSTSSVVGAYHHGSLAHQQAAMLACLGDKPGAISALQESLRHRPPSEHRSRAITQARLAELQLGCGRVEEAAGTWNRFLDTYSIVSSGRANTAIVTLRARMRPHRKIPAVRSLLHRATTLIVETKG